MRLASSSAKTVHDRQVLEPGVTSPASPNAMFWFVMQVGMIFGFLTTYPAN